MTNNDCDNNDYEGITITTIKHSDLVFFEGVNQGTIDIVDNKAKRKNNYIFGYSSDGGVSIAWATWDIIAMGWGIHWADVTILQVSVTKKHLQIF